MDCKPRSLALLEVGNLSPALVVADRCTKSADVHLLAIENSDSGDLCLKLIGSAAAVREAGEQGAALARHMGSSAFLSVLPAPTEETMGLVDTPAVYVPLLDTYDSLVPREESMEAINALGLLETQGLVANLHATDVMLKTSGVTVLGKEKIGGGFVTIMISGDLAAVQTAIEAGGKTVEQLGGKLILADVVSNPHPDLAALLPVGSD